MEIEELEAIVARAEKAMSPEDHRRLKAAIETFAWLASEIEQKSASIARLQRLLFGAKTEKAAHVLGANPLESGRSEESGGPSQDKKRRRGHGRNGASAYPGAERISVPHESLRAGDCCPSCKKGKVYRRKEPQTLIRVTGQAPLPARAYEKEVLRCSRCQEVFVAKSPEGVGDEKYDEAAGSIIAVLKYGTGFPFHRLERLEKGFGIPLPEATQWEIVAGVADVVAPAHEELKRQAAQGEVLHNDDTPMTILSLLPSSSRPNESEADGDEGDEGDEEKENKERKGVRTSGIVAKTEGHEIALFFTGREHAGENLGKVLAKRAKETAPPIQMCDGLTSNHAPAEFVTILSNCVAHGRRKFVELVSAFPDECRHVIQQLCHVYAVDAEAREKKLSPEGRLELHREKSARVMAELEMWMREKIEKREIEPNSPLGGAIEYMLKRWENLTLFLRQPGAPLDNNICERALKKAILHRKNALFFKTENGARVGDIFMSLIHTAELAGANPFDYLTELQRHPADLRQDASAWMPWNYRATIETRAAAPVTASAAQPP